jgi:hypothetical protein
MNLANTTHHYEDSRAHQQEMRLAKQAMSRSGFDKEKMGKILKQANVQRSAHEVTRLQCILTLWPLKYTIRASSRAKSPYIFFRRLPCNNAISF